MGRLLHEVGAVSQKEAHKHQREAAQMGKVGRGGGGGWRLRVCWLLTASIAWACPRTHSNPSLFLGAAGAPPGPTQPAAATARSARHHPPTTPRHPQPPTPDTAARRAGLLCVGLGPGRAAGGARARRDCRRGDGALQHAPAGSHAAGRARAQGLCPQHDQRRGAGRRGAAAGGRLAGWGAGWAGLGWAGLGWQGGGPEAVVLLLVGASAAGLGAALHWLWALERWSWSQPQLGRAAAR
jgi:hypothetical protein